MALILVTHDLGVVDQAVDRVAVMYAGEIVELATDRRPLRPAEPPVHDRSHPVDPERRSPCGGCVPIPGSPPDLAALGKGCPFAPRCPLAAAECLAGDVPLVAVGPGHWSRCLRVDHLAELRA